jgi:hypothetical protein
MISCEGQHNGFTSLPLSPFSCSIEQKLQPFRRGSCWLAVMIAGGFGLRWRVVALSMSSRRRFSSSMLLVCFRFQCFHGQSGIACMRVVGMTAHNGKIPLDAKQLKHDLITRSLVWKSSNEVCSRDMWLPRVVLSTHGMLHMTAIYQTNYIVYATSIFMRTLQNKEAHSNRTFLSQCIYPKTKCPLPPSFPSNKQQKKSKKYDKPQLLQSKEGCCASSGSRTRANCLEGNYPTVGPRMLDGKFEI